eukprot:Ihof_evm9s68 gene=Ihof_evmTU9s68
MLSSNFHKLAASVVVGGSAYCLLKTLKIQKVLAHTDGAENPEALDPDKFKPFEVAFIEKLTHDTKLYRFKLDTPTTPLGMTVAGCLLTKTPGSFMKPVIRPYTPTTGPEVLGHFDLVIKTYPEGHASQYFDNLKPGDKVEMKGPITKYPVTHNMKKKIAFLAGGTGITPMYQIIHEILRDPANTTKLILLFANKTSNDIMLKKELDQLAANHPDAFTVHYMIDKPEEGWKGLTGYMNRDLLKRILPEPSDDNLIFVCGPPGLMKAICGEKQGPREQ